MAALGGGGGGLLGIIQVQECFKAYLCPFHARASHRWNESVLAGHWARWQHCSEPAQIKVCVFCPLQLEQIQTNKQDMHSWHDLKFCRYNSCYDSEKSSVKQLSLCLSHTLFAITVCEVCVRFVQWVLQACKKVEVNLAFRCLLLALMLFDIFRLIHDIFFFGMALSLIIYCSTWREPDFDMSLH